MHLLELRQRPTANECLNHGWLSLRDTSLTARNRILFSSQPLQQFRGFYEMLHHSRNAPSEDLSVGSAASEVHSIGSAASEERWAGSAVSEERSVGSVASEERSVGSAVSEERSVGSAVSQERSVGSAVSEERSVGSGASGSSQQASSPELLHAGGADKSGPSRDPKGHVASSGSATFSTLL